MAFHDNQPVRRSGGKSQDDARGVWTTFTTFLASKRHFGAKLGLSIPQVIDLFLGGGGVYEFN